MSLSKRLDDEVNRRDPLEFEFIEPSWWRDSQLDDEWLEAHSGSWPSEQEMRDDAEREQ